MLAHLGALGRHVGPLGRHLVPLARHLIANMSENVPKSSKTAPKMPQTPLLSLEKVQKTKEKPTFFNIFSKLLQKTLVLLFLQYECKNKEGLRIALRWVAKTFIFD